MLVWVAGAHAEQTGFFVPKSLCTEIKQPSTDHVVCWDPTAKTLKYWNGTAYIAAPAGGSITVNAGAGTGLTIVGSPVAIGGTVTLGTTSDALRYGALGLNTAAGAAGTLNATSANVPLAFLLSTGGVLQLGAAEPTTLKIVAGSAGAPITADRSTVVISRYDSVPTPAVEQEALRVISVSHGVGTAQPTAIVGEAWRLGVLQGFTGGADSLGIGGVARNYGDGFAAFGGYFEANTFTATAGAIGAEVSVRNQGNTAHGFGDVVPLTGFDINYSSTGGDFVGGQAIGIRAVAGAGRWDIGIAFGYAGFSDSIVTASIRDETSATHILLAPSGTHVNGINLAAGATFSGNAFSSPGFAVSGTGSTTMTQAVLSGATSGTLTVKAAAVAGTNTLTLPAGTTDFSATGGASQVVKQTSAGGALTVAQLAASDLSNGTTGSGAVALATSPTFVTTILGDMSNATHASRLLVMTSTTNGTTNLGVAPNGTSTTAQLNLYGSSSVNDAAIARVAINASTMSVSSTGVGTFTFVPLAFATSNTTRMTVTVAGAVNLSGFTFANIGTVLTTDGDFGYCSDCAAGALGVPANCAGAGTGAFAMQLNGTARCWN